MSTDAKTQKLEHQINEDLFLCLTAMWMYNPVLYRFRITNKSIQENFPNFTNVLAPSHYKS